LADDALAFAKEETKSRKTSRKECLTKKLDQSQWKEFRMHLETHCSAGKSKKKGKKLMETLREYVLSWILYPELKGEKPNEWNRVLQEFVNNNTK
jgi:hypothetical protein